MLAAHGAGDDSDANRGIRRLADELTRLFAGRLGGSRVGTVFHLGEPGFESLRGLKDTVVLPLLTSRGYFHRRLERALGDAPELLPPLGEHPRTHALLRRELESHVRDIPRHELGVLVIGHGTRRDAQSGETTRRLTRSLQDALPGARVESAFLDQEPTLRDVATRLAQQRRTILTLPFLLGRAGHAREDVDAAFASFGPASTHRRIQLPALLDLPQLPRLLVEIATGQGPAEKERRVA